MPQDFLWHFLLQSILIQLKKISILVPSKKLFDYNYEFSLYIYQNSKLKSD